MTAHFSSGMRLKLLTISMALLPFGAKAQVAPSDMVRVEGRVQSEEDRKDIKGTQADQVTQYKNLTIIISGAPKSPETRTATWVAYVRDVRTHALQPLERGEFKVDLSSGPQKFETKRISTSFTPEHSVDKRGLQLKSGKWQTQRVPAAGKKFVGFAVTVKEGDKVVGKFSDPMGVDTQVK